MDLNRLKEMNENTNDVLMVIGGTALLEVIACFIIVVVYGVVVLTIKALMWIAVVFACFLGAATVITGLVKLFFVGTIYWESD